MKYLNIVIFIIIQINFISAQEEYYDSIINEIDRKYTKTITKNDSFFINQLIKKTIDSSNCEELKNQLIGDKTSKIIKEKFIKMVIENNICLDVLWNYISFYHYDIYSDDINGRGIDHYPIYQYLKNNSEYLYICIDYLLNSGYLDDCSYILKFDKIHLRYIYNLLSNNDTLLNYININLNNINKCKLANLILLSNSYEKGFIHDFKYKNTMAIPKLKIK